MSDRSSSANRRHDGHDRPAQRAGSVDLFAVTQERDAQVVELGQHLDEVLHAAGQSVGGPDHHDVEPAAAGVGHHAIERRAAGTSTADAVIDVFLDDLEAALLGH